MLVGDAGDAGEKPSPLPKTPVILGESLLGPTSSSQLRCRVGGSQLTASSEHPCLDPSPPIPQARPAPSPKQSKRQRQGIQSSGQDARVDAIRRVPLWTLAAAHERPSFSIFCCARRGRDSMRLEDSSQKLKPSSGLQATHYWTKDRFLGRLVDGGLDTACWPPTDRFLSQAPAIMSFKLVELGHICLPKLPKQHAKATCRLCICRCTPVCLDAAEMGPKTSGPCRILFSHPSPPPPDIACANSQIYFSCVSVRSPVVGSFSYGQDFSSEVHTYLNPASLACRT